MNFFDEDSEEGPIQSREEYDFLFGTTDNVLKGKVGLKQQIDRHEAGNEAPIIWDDEKNKFIHVFVLEVETGEGTKLEHLFGLEEAKKRYNWLNREVKSRRMKRSLGV